MRMPAWWIGLFILANIARGQEGKELPVGELNATPEVSKGPESGKDTDFKAESESESIETIPPPDWVRDAIWYYLDVGRFRNGETDNEPSSLPPWGERRGGQGLDGSNFFYGGDLQGLRAQLPYLKQLGVNALVLDGVFPITTVGRIEASMYVIDGIGVRSNEKRSVADTWTDSDRLFLDVVAEAQRQGFHVVVRFPHPIGAERWRTTPLEFSKYADFVWRMNERWLRKPNHTTKHRGIDGWADTSEFPGANVYGADWRSQIKKNNRECALIVLNPHQKGDRVLIAGREADAVINTEYSDEVVGFFQQEPLIKPEVLTAIVGSIRGKVPQCLHSSLGIESSERLLGCLAYPMGVTDLDTSIEAAKIVTPDNVNRWRLAMVFQLFSSNDYAIPFGEEVGMVQEGPPWYPEPMWWNDLENPESKRPTYRGDFYALIQMLNTFRARFAPLRRGDFKPVIADDEKKLLAFARTMPGDEVILVMNYGATKQSVSLTVGQPGELVPVLAPQLKPMTMPRKGQPAPPEPDLTKIPELRVGAQREFVKPNGTIDFWVDPMGVRIVLIGASARATMK